MARAAEILVDRILDLADPGRRRCDTDGQLLARWAADRDGRAFAALVARHGGLVWRVARGVLPQAEDAEDVFQATFLVLARKAAALGKHATLTGWLYQTAYRLALKARTSAERRRHRENQAPSKAPGDPLEEISAREARTMLAEELERLSASYREPILLCLYQGLTQDEAARQLGISRRTLKRRLERARVLLGQRLSQRGVAPAIALALTLYTSSRAPAHLARATVAAATQFGSGKTVTGGAALLAQGMLQTWLLKTVAGYLGIAVVLGSLTVAGGLAFLPRERNEGKRNLLLAAQAPARPVKVKAEAPRLDVNGDPLPPGALARIGSNRLRHSAPVSRLVYTPDGKALASTSMDGFLHVWDSANGKLRWRIKMVAENATIVGALTVSGDGKRLAVLNDSEFTLVELETGKTLIRHDWPRVNNEPNALSVALSQDQSTIARGCGDGTVHLYDGVTGREKLRFVLDRDALDGLPMGMRFSADGKKIYVAPYRKSAIMVFETQGGKKVQSLDFPGRVDFCNLVSSQKDQWLAAIQRDRVVIWDLTTGKRRHSVENKSGNHSGTFSPDGSLFAVNATEEDILLLDPTSGKEQRRLVSRASIGTMAFAADGKTIAAASNSGCITLWDVATAKQRAPSPVPTRVWRHRFVNHGTGILSIGGGDCIDLWSVANSQLVRRLARNGEWFNYYTMAISADAKLIAVDLADLHTEIGRFTGSKLVLMDFATGEVIRTLNEGKCLVGSNAFSPDGTLLFTSAAMPETAGLSAPHVTIWEVANGKRLGQMNSDVPVVQLAVSPNGRWLAAQSYTKPGDSIHLWDVKTGKLVHRLSPPSERTHAMVFSADGSQLASVGINMGPGLHGEVHLWDVATGKEARAFTGNKERLIAVAITPDGRTVATNGRDSAVLLWEVASGKERGEITGHDGTPVSIDFSPDSETLAAASSDAPIYLWKTYAVRKSKLTGAKLSRTQREDLWRQLAGDSAENAFQSICELIARPGEAVAILKGAWNQIPRATLQQMQKWIINLNSDQFAIRKTADAELERFGADHLDLLREALKQPASLETRQRLEKIVARVNPERLRRDRMLEVLEHLHTEPARRFLQELAKQKDDSTMARAAAASLERLAQLRAATP